MLSMQSWSKKLQSFQKNEDGSILILFGLTVIMLFMFAGCGLDFARAQHAQSKATAALDAATLAAAKAMREQPGLSDAQLLTIAQQVFDADVVRAGVGGTTWTPVAFTPAPDRKTGTIKATVGGEVATYFYRVAGPNYTKLPVGRTSTVAYNQIDVELGVMIDVTGSMANYNKIGDMKSAVKTLADIMLPSGGSPTNAKIGIAPFSGGVNLGAYASVASGGRSKDGCVIERLSPGYRASDVAPTTAAFGVKGDMATNGAYACPNAKLIPLTDDHDKIVNTVNTYSPGGCTAGHLGATWAWNLISPNWSSVWPTAPAPYNDGKTVKAVILMTDGLFNTGFVNSGSNCDDYNPLSGNQAKQVCDAMKAQGVIVYTVGFRLSLALPSATTTLAACATDAAHALLAENGAELNTAFANIAVQLNNLRVTQ